jgi:predicted DNA-binding protein YlxM (UPF0122 family)
MKNKQPKPEHLCTTLLSIGQFAEKMKVTRHSVYYHIKTSKRIIPTLIGMNKDVYIDYSVYKDFDFRAENNPK